ncbi:hypothetical protein V8B97DRAFT_1293098 [Scleroderma yunnanense]
MVTPRKISKGFAVDMLHGHRRRATPGTLPVEVLSEIFVFASLSHDDPNDTIVQPITISHVCRRWRQISIHTSLLWRNIYLFFPLTTHQLTRTTAWLSRSHHQPLHICMDFRDPSWDWNEYTHRFNWQAMETVMRFLLPKVHLWQSVELYTDTWAPMFTFLSYTTHARSAPCLRDIQLARCNAYFAGKGETFQPASMVSPVAWFNSGTGFSGLRNVSLSGVHVNWEKSGLQGLRVLELKYHAQDVMPSVEDFFAIMQACPQLERLTILGWGPRINHILGISPPTVQLPSLEDLSLGYVDVDYAIDLLSMISVPNLRSFSLEDVAVTLDPSDAQDASRLFDYFSSLINGDSVLHLPLPSIRTLSLRGVTVGNGTICPFLSLLRSVETLYLSGMDASSVRSLLEGMSLCSCLDTLVLDGIEPAILSVVLASISDTRKPGLRIFMDPPVDAADTDITA